ncbi:hypothetical protein C5B97_02355 [Pseudoclavibacter sp. RFBB5]|nr:hypothetical protein C5B97_02355 [Pseudoclavibacter sp. RFBB5]
MRNFGDEMSPLAWSIASSSKAQWSPPSSADAIAIGSILHLALRDARRDLLVWGTGGRQDLTSAEKQRLDSWNILAVRGPRTAALLGSESVVTGDPGLFASELLSRPIRKKSGKKIYLPHFRAWSTNEGIDGIRSAKKLGFQVLTPAHSPKHIAEQIAESQYLAASSLHGLIFAHALGVPAMAVTPPGQEPDFKYRDHYESVGARLTFRSLDQVATALETASSLDSLPEVAYRAEISREAGVRREALAKALIEHGV